jgi:hypothetical protein
MDRDVRQTTHGGNEVKRAITVAALCAGLVALSAPAAPGADNLGAVAKECAKLKKVDRVAFRATFGPRHAMRHCIKGNPVEMSETTPAEFRNAAKECRAEREADAATFQETYGTNAGKRNAFGKCVSGKVKHQPEEPEEPELPEEAAAA